MISARVIADSIAPNRVRLTTVEATFNRYILAEVNTYREWSRNSASSRAIPVEKVMRQVWNDPATPIHWGKNQRGMQARAELTGWRRWLARKMFLAARVPILVIVWMLTKLRLHKQVANRLLEPWVWHTAIISSTNWQNMFGQRDHEDAQPEFRQLARCIKAAIAGSVPREVSWGDWHLPYIVPEDYAEAASLTRDEASDWFPDVVFMSVSRCAAVSYVRQNERNARKDIALSIRLREGKHWSPFEHVAQATENHIRDSNFDAGWKQLRKFYMGEDGRG
jgi:hypothetical protein